MKYFLITLAMFACVSTQAQAIVISFEPSSQTVEIGDTVNVDLRISELGNDILTGFDLDVSFDDSILGFNGVDFGTGLDVFGLGTINDVIDFGFGTVNVFELSFDLDSDLHAFQPDDFVLGTFNFSALNSGVSSLDASIWGLSGEFVFDDALGYDVPESLWAEVHTGSVAVPEPGVLMLLLSGLFGLCLSRRAR